METAYDFTSVTIFAGLIVLFLQRSVSPPSKPDPLWPYLAASIGCAAFNFLGNEGWDGAALVLLALLLLFIALVLRPFPIK